MASNDDFEPPEQFDEYRLLRPLGRGGMGQVFLCHDTKLDRRVAVKFIRHLDVGTEARQRFETEARAIARLDAHHNVVAVHRLGEYSGHPYLVYQYIAGQSLDSLPKPIPYRDVLRLGIGLARGLAAVHKQHVLHRDIKPANIMLSEEGQVKLLDFGLAKLLDVGAKGAAGVQPVLPVLSSRAILAETSPALAATLDSPRSLPAGRQDSSWAQLTETGSIMGTPRYLAPELWQGETATPRTDIYSLGAVLYELVTGKPPYDATDIRSLRDAMVNQEVRALTRQVPGIPPAFAALIERCLNRNPEQRFASAQELLAALEAIQQAIDTKKPPELVRRSRRLLRTLSFGASGTLAIIGVFSWYYIRPVDGMVQFAGATFLMGATTDEIQSAKQWCTQLLGSECDQDIQKTLHREQPQRQVTLSPYKLDRREVTNQEFADWLNAEPGIELLEGRYVKQAGVLLADVYPMYEPFSGFVYDSAARRFSVPTTFLRRPVTQISWHGAERYCRAHAKRLPTEAEWEFAARGTEGRRFPWGYDEPQCQGVVFARETAMSCVTLGIGPVNAGTALADVTPDGIHDLGGSVAEWVADHFEEQYGACPPPCRDPVNRSGTDDPGTLRVVRGGAWMWPALLARSTGRSRYAANKTPRGFGFRCARSVHEPYASTP